MLQTPSPDRTAHNTVYMWGGGVATQTVLCAVLSVGEGGLQQTVLRALMYAGVGYNTDRTAHNIYGGFATQTVMSCLSAGGGGLQQCYMPYAGGWLGLQQTVLRAILSVCSGWLVCVVKSETFSTTGF